MDLYPKYKSPLGYEIGDDGIDSYGVDHSGFSTRDELEYQMARQQREQQLMQNYSSQGITQDYPQYGTDFWGDNNDNNYGFGTSDISGNVQNITNMLDNGSQGFGLNNGQVFANSDYTINTESLVGKPSSYFQDNNQQQLRMPTRSEQQLTMHGYELQQPRTSAWDKVKNAANNFASGTEAFSVGYATGASLGNFDEAMGTATAAVTGNPDNYTMGRNAVRQLQNDLQQHHPYIYGGAEFVGAMQTPMHLFKDITLANKARNAITDTISASAGYAENWDDFVSNLMVNGAANIAGLSLERLPIGRAFNSSTGKKLLTNGYKFARQGINSVADKFKNRYYKKNEDE